jgi:hypothetical protein
MGVVDGLTGWRRVWVVFCGAGLDAAWDFGRACATVSRAARNSWGSGYRAGMELSGSGSGDVAAKGEDADTSGEDRGERADDHGVASSAGGWVIVLAVVVARGWISRIGRGAAR